MISIYQTFCSALLSIYISIYLLKDCIQELQLPRKKHAGLDHLINLILKLTFYNQQLQKVNETNLMKGSG